VTAQMEPRPLPFSARHYEDRLKGLPDQRSKGFHKGQTERLVRDLITEVVQVQTTNALLVTKEQAAQDALRFHADERAAAGHPWELDGPPTMAIEAVVVGQQMAERHDRAANAEITYRLANADRMQREAQALLDQAKAAAVAPSAWPPASKRRRSTCRTAGRRTRPTGPSTSAGRRTGGPSWSARARPSTPTGPSWRTRSGHSPTARTASSPRSTT
jgi:hypothetical protein